jgi:hypothetical protein
MHAFVNIRDLIYIGFIQNAPAYTSHIATSFSTASSLLIKAKINIRNRITVLILNIDFQNHFIARDKRYTR